MARRKSSRSAHPQLGHVFLRRLVTVAVLSAVLVIFAPPLIAHTPLLRAVVAGALHDLDGSVHISRASLGWLSPPVFEDVEVRDSSGQTMLAIGRVAGSRTLLGLAFDGGDLGTFRLERPVLWFRSSGGMTNVERALVRYLRPGAGSGASSLPAFRLELVDAKVLLRDEDAGQEWTLDQLAVSARTGRDKNAPLEVHLSGRVTDGNASTAVGADLTLRLPSDRTHTEALQAEGNIDCDNLPLGFLAPLLRRAVPSLSLDGRLAAHAKGSLHFGGQAPPELHLVGEVAARVVSLAGVRSGTDRLQLERLRADCDVTLQGGRLVVRRAELACDLGQASVEGELTIGEEPSAAPNRSGLHVRLHGELGRIAALAPGLEARQIAGQADFSVSLRSDSKGIWTDDCRLTLRDIRLAGMGVHLAEPTLELTAAARWLREVGRLESDELQVACPSLTARASGIRIDLDAAGTPTASGQAAITARLGGLRQWFTQPGGAAPTPLDGALKGRVTIQTSAQAVAATADLTITDFTVGNPASTVWREPQLRLSAAMHYDAAGDVLQIEKLTFEGAGVSASAAGQLMQPAASGDFSLSGQAHYDWQQLEPRLQVLLGQSVQVKGQETRPFRVEGSLWAPSLLAGVRAEAGIGWQSVQAYGCQVAAGQLQASVAGGWLRMAAIETTLNQGKVRLEPSARLSPGPVEAYLARGSCVERFQLTTAACAGALGYALPGLANALEAEGQASLVIDSARLPLANPAAAEVDGHFVIHSGRVGPGPLARELGVLLRVPAGAGLARESIVPFHMANGRISHQNLELAFPDLTIRTQGSVGVDGSLDLFAEMPLPPKWLGGGKAGQLLAGRRVRLPIRGTLSNPQIDQGALRNVYEQAAREIGKAAAKQELQRGLEGLFNRRK